MGAYLSSPVTDKISTDKTCKDFTYGASSMQGWRISQEDAHNCIPDLDSETSLFAVYDGHGGSEVAQYCSQFLPGVIQSSQQYGEGELGPALVDAFLKLDATLVEEEVIKTLKQLAGHDDNDDDDEEEDPVGRAEAEDLKAEADLPLDQLLAKYQTPPSSAAVRQLRKKENIQSPVVRAKQSPSQAGPSSSSEAGLSEEATPGSSQVSSSSAAPCSRLTNGLADNENNLNTEKELRDNNNAKAPEPGCADSSNGQGCAADKLSPGEGGSGDCGSEGKGGGGSAPCSSGDAGGSAGCGSSSGSGDAGSTSGSGGGSSGAGACSSDAVSSSTGEDEEGPSGSCSGKTSKTPSKSQEAMDEDDSDDEEEDDEDEWQDVSGDEDDDDDDDDEGMEEGDDPTMDMSNEEPGSDSGCTACVVLMRNDRLIVANAGDSRCVLCRGGKAFELSFDHKPEDDIEKQRIEKAGGKVTCDGRVNGGLNLSRAIGDHFYKRKEDLPPEEQMITALPDIKTVDLEADDSFFVVACDGIWNSMTSQECVDFIAERLKDPVKKAKPSIICEELFDHCLSPNTYGDGTGCDNMTCIIVVLQAPGERRHSQAEDNGPVPSKRCVGDVPMEEKSLEKRPRVEEGETTAQEGKGDPE